MGWGGVGWDWASREGWRVSTSPELVGPGPSYHQVPSSLEEGGVEHKLSWVRCSLLTAIRYPLHARQGLCQRLPQTSSPFHLQPEHTLSWGREGLRLLPKAPAI